jgi:hypothetical protein
MTIQDDSATPTGTLPEDFTRWLDAWGARNRPAPPSRWQRSSKKGLKCEV